MDIKEIKKKGCNYFLRRNPLDSDMFEIYNLWKNNTYLVGVAHTDLFNFPPEIDEILAAKFPSEEVIIPFEFKFESVL